MIPEGAIATFEKLLQLIGVFKQCLILANRLRV